MRIGIPSEIKVQEARVALIPEACAELKQQGHDIVIQSGAGTGCGYPDAAYQAHGIACYADAASVYDHAQLLIKVKEPQPQEYGYFRADQRLFCFLHLAALPDLRQQLQTIGLTAIGFETVMENQQLPLLQGMSIIAGKLAVHAGSHYLQHHKGLLLGGLAGTERGEVMVLGAGNAGYAAASAAAKLGATVRVFDLNMARLDQARQIGDNVHALYAYRQAISRYLPQTDLLIGAVLVPGAKAPQVVSHEMVKSMASNSVIVDIAVDQGGCIATTHATDYDHPSYRQDDVIHYAVTNMPAAVARTASQALSASLLPYVSRLCAEDWQQDVALQAGINVQAGQCADFLLG